MTKSELLEYIRRKLGEPIIKVELTDEQIEDASSAALRWFNANKGILKVGSFDAVEGVNAYKLPKEVKSVSNVYFVEPGYGNFLGGLSDIMQDFGWTPGLVPLPRGRLPAFSGVVLFLQKMESVVKIAAREPTWEFRDGVLYIYPSPTGARVGKYYYDYKRDVVDIEELSGYPKETDLLVRRIIAECKETLGRIRSKYGAYPAAEGTVELDGATLLAEAKEEKEKLDAEVIEKSFPVPFIVG